MAKLGGATRRLLFDAIVPPPTRFMNPSEETKLRMEDIVTRPPTTIVRLIADRSARIHLDKYFGKLVHFDDRLEDVGQDSVRWIRIQLQFLPRAGREERVGRESRSVIHPRHGHSP